MFAKRKSAGVVSVIKVAHDIFHVGPKQATFEISISINFLPDFQCMVVFWFRPSYSAKATSAERVDIHHG